MIIVLSFKVFGRPANTWAGLVKVVQWVMRVRYTGLVPTPLMPHVAYANIN